MDRDTAFKISILVLLALVCVVVIIDVQVRQGYIQEYLNMTETLMVQSGTGNMSSFCEIAQMLCYNVACSCS